MSKFCKAAMTFLLIIITGSIVGCNPQKSTDIRGLFTFDGWDRKVPKHGVLYQYKKGSDFTILEQKYESGFKPDMMFSDNPKNKPNLEVRFAGSNDFSTESDYKLVLDNDIEYRIYDLESVYGKEGCSLSTGKVNKCEFERSCGIDVHSSCGEPVNTGK